MHKGEEENVPRISSLLLNVKKNIAMDPVVYWHYMSATYAEISKILSNIINLPIVRHYIPEHKSVWLLLNETYCADPEGGGGPDPLIFQGKGFGMVILCRTNPGLKIEPPQPA